MYKTLDKLQVVFIFIIIIAFVATIKAVCPPERDISPCTCDDEGLQCSRIGNLSLSRVFNARAERLAIRKVWIFQTNVTNIPSHSFGGYIIRDLFLDFNQISRVDPMAFKTNAELTLQHISLTRNLLSSFPFESLTRMKKLKKLGLSFNKFASISSRAFPRVESLEDVDLANNQIASIGAFAFEKLSALSSIYLGNNELKRIESNSLVVRKSPNSTEPLLHVSLRNNKIEFFARDAFGGNGGGNIPQLLDLSDNKLTYLDERIFKPLVENGTWIEVGGNPFACTGCNAYKWLVDIDSELESKILSFKCENGYKLDELTLSLIGCPEQDYE